MIEMSYERWYCFLEANWIVRFDTVNIVSQLEMGDAFSRLHSYVQRIRESMDGHKIAIVVDVVACFFFKVCSVLLDSLLCLCV